jgi:polar amino acid transport system ATP-binding protein
MSEGQLFMSDKKIIFENVKKTYGDLIVLDDFNFHVDPNEAVAIIGPSGSGKTTILRLLMTLEKMQEGLVYIDDEPINMMKVNDKLVPVSNSYIRRIRSKIGMVFQNFNLFPHMTALQNCIESPVHTKGLSKTQAIDESKKILDSVGLSDKYDNYPSQLSGGQQQRVAIARALAMRPEILLFDEPTSSLDPEMIGEVLNVIRDLIKSKKYTVLLATHQMGFAKEVSDRVCFFNDGNIIEEGKPEKIFNNPKNERLKKFLSKILEAS